MLFVVVTWLKGGGKSLPLQFTQAMNDTVYTDSRRIKASLGSQVEYCQIFKAPSQAMIIREMIGNKQKAEGNF